MTIVLSNGQSHMLHIVLSDDVFGLSQQT